MFYRSFENSCMQMLLWVIQYNFALHKRQHMFCVAKGRQKVKQNTVNSQGVVSKRC